MIGIIQIDQGNRPAFQLGKVVATPLSLERIFAAGQTPEVFLERHLSCDWGILCDEDKRLNDDALSNDLRLLSSYKTALGDKLYLITEWDRSSTCILLPEEY